MSRLYASLRPLARQMTVKAWPGPVRARRKLLVSGLPRSGTSWVAKVIALAPGVSYYFEPDHSLDQRYNFKYLAAQDDDAILGEFMQKAFRGAVNEEYVIAEQGFKDMLRHPWSHTVLCKVVHLTLMLDWVRRRFPGTRVVQVVRHPVPVFLSWQARDWEPEHALKLLLRQESLIQGPLKPYQDVMRNADTHWAKAAAFWSAITRMQLLQHQAGDFMLEHEWLCYDPVPRFRGVIEALGLQWRDEMEQFLTAGHPGSGPGYGSWRKPASEIGKWRGKVSAGEMDEMRAVVREFDLPCYRNLDLVQDELTQSLAEHQGRFHVQ